LQDLQAGKKSYSPHKMSPFQFSTLGCDDASSVAGQLQQEKLLPVLTKDGYCRSSAMVVMPHVPLQVPHYN
jgi:hypothetical protein